MQVIDTLIHLVLLVSLPPLLPSIIAKTKALFAGRVGPPLLQRPAGRELARSVR